MVKRTFQQIPTHCQINRLKHSQHFALPQIYFESDVFLRTFVVTCNGKVDKRHRIRQNSRITIGISVKIQKRSKRRNCYKVAAKCVMVSVLNYTILSGWRGGWHRWVSTHTLRMMSLVSGEPAKASVQSLEDCCENFFSTARIGIGIGRML